MTKDSRIKPLDIIELKEDVKIDVRDIEDYRIGKDHVRDLKSDLALLRESQSVESFKIKLKDYRERTIDLNNMLSLDEDLNADLTTFLENQIITKINQITTELNNLATQE